MDVKNGAETNAKTEQDDLVPNNADNQNTAGNKALESNDAEMEHRAARSEDCEQLGILDVLDRLQTLAG
jgi:hypothetical protein